MRLDRPENPRKTAFRDGLRLALRQCAAILLEGSYPRYLRLAMAADETEVLRVAVKSGHGGTCAMVAAYLSEAADQGILPPMDFTLQAEILMGQVQANDFARALAGIAPDPKRTGERVDQAVATFCREKLL
ncbi:MAG: TetR/AcrR family transcriptional regulator C-terminal domain-containing protein [Magnetospirillum sp.]